MSQQVYVVVNPAAGGDPYGVADAVRERGKRAGATVDVVATDRPGHAEEIAAGLRAAAGDIVVVAGGDGTVRDVVSGLYQAHRGDPATMPALLVSPAGTGNSSYLGIWGGRSWPEVLDRVFAVPGAGLGARVCRLDLAVVAESGRLVVLGAGSGLIAEALVTARELATLAGPQRYRQAVAMTMRRFRPYPGRVLVDGEVLAEGPALMVVVGGGQFRGGGFRLLPESVLDDGLLDVCVCGGVADPADLATLAATGAHLGHPEVRYARGTRITVERTDGADLVFESDGDLDGGAGPTRTLQVLPQAMPVLISH